MVPVLLVRQAYAALRSVLATTFDPAINRGHDLRRLDFRRIEWLLAGQAIPQRWVQQWRSGGRNAWQHSYWMSPDLDEVEDG